MGDNKFNFDNWDLYYVIKDKDGNEKRIGPVKPLDINKLKSR